MRHPHRNRPHRTPGDKRSRSETGRSKDQSNQQTETTSVPRTTAPHQFALDQSAVSRNQTAMLVYLGLGKVHTAHPGRLSNAARYKLWLDCAAVDTPAVENSTDLGSDIHVPFCLSAAAFDEHVHRRYDLRFGQLPDVQLMDRKNTRYILHRFFHGVERYGRGNALKEDERGRFHCEIQHGDSLSAVA